MSSNSTKSSSSVASVSKVRVSVAFSMSLIAECKLLAVSAWLTMAVRLSFANPKDDICTRSKGYEMGSNGPVFRTLIHS